MRRLGVWTTKAWRRTLTSLAAHHHQVSLKHAASWSSTRECTTHHHADDASPLTSSPQAPPTLVREGKAEIVLHGNDVFYNKVQVVNRDLSIAVLQSFVTKRKEELCCREELKRAKDHDHACCLTGESEVVGLDESCVQNATRSAPATPFTVLEALAASGLRAIRYAQEVEGIDSVVALDRNKVAVEACQRNVKLNGEAVSSKIHVQHGDAQVYMLNHQKQFDVVDVDPYGSPCTFLDSAVQCVKDGGLLMCTATDMSVLCGSFGEVCYTKYGSYALKGKHCHEMAVRILLSSIESHANRYKRHIVPVLSVSLDFYARVFVRIYTSPINVKKTPSKLSYIYQCNGCDSFHLQPVGHIFEKSDSTRYMPGIGPSLLPNCKECGKHWEVGGPIWSNPIHDQKWVLSILRDVAKEKDRFPAFEKVHGLLTAVSEELVDVPLFVNPHALSNTLKCVSPSHIMFCSALVNAGYRTSCSHVCPLGLKTDAPMDAIWDIMRCWVKLHPIKIQPDNTVGSIILSKEPVLEANFSWLTKAQRKEPTKKFPLNPEANWGPKRRAGRKMKSMGSNAE